MQVNPFLPKYATLVSFISVADDTVRSLLSTDEVIIAKQNCGDFIVVIDKNSIESAARRWWKGQ